MDRKSGIAGLRADMDVGFAAKAAGVMAFGSRRRRARRLVALPARNTGADHVVVRVERPWRHGTPAVPAASSREVNMMVGTARQCPRCELRFLDQPELEDHLRTEHGLAHVTHVFETALEDPIPR